MGWTIFSDKSKKDVIEIIAAEGAYNPAYPHSPHIIKKCLRGNCLWTVFQKHHANGEVHRFVVLFLLESAGLGQWGYKDIEESMGPYETSCPVSYLDACTAPVNEHSASWRERVRAKAAEKDKSKSFIKTLRVGDEFMLRQGLSVRGAMRVISPASRGKIAAQHLESGVCYQIKADQIQNPC